MLDAIIRKAKSFKDTKADGIKISAATYQID